MVCPANPAESATRPTWSSVDCYPRFVVGSIAGFPPAILFCSKGQTYSSLSLVGLSEPTPARSAGGPCPLPRRFLPRAPSRTLQRLGTKVAALPALPSSASVQQAHPPATAPFHSSFHAPSCLRLAGSLAPAPCFATIGRSQSAPVPAPLERLNSSSPRTTPSWPLAASLQLRMLHAAIEIATRCTATRVLH